MIEIIIPGVVVPKGRPRFSRRGGSVRTHTPTKTLNYERVVKMHAIPKKPVHPIDEAIEVHVYIHKTPPKSWSKVKCQEAINGVIKLTTKPDIDNYAKGILDAMNGIIFKDDNLINKLTIEKRYSSEDKAVVKINRL